MKKYIVFRNAVGGEFALVFPTSVQHWLVSVYQEQIVSAGFVEYSLEEGELKAKCFGFSESLNIASRPEVDERLVLDVVL